MQKRKVKKKRVEVFIKSVLGTENNEPGFKTKIKINFR